MSHRVEAFVGLGSKLRPVFRCCAPLQAGLVLVPITELGTALRDELPIAPFYALTPSVLAAARKRVSADTMLGYIETDYFAGPGEQRGAAWLGDDVLVSPQQADSIVNTVLRTLGVVRAPGKDEWDTIDLVRYRSTDDIVTAASKNASP